MQTCFTMTVQFLPTADICLVLNFVFWIILLWVLWLLFFTRYISESYSSKTQKSKECLRKMRKSLQWHWAFPGSHGKRACHDCLYCMKCGFDEVKTHLVRVHMWRRHTRFIGTSEDLNEASNLLAYCQNQSHALCGADTLVLSQMRLQAAYPRIFQVYSWNNKRAKSFNCNL